MEKIIEISLRELAKNTYLESNTSFIESIYFIKLGEKTYLNKDFTGSINDLKKISLDESYIVLGGGNNE